MKAVLRHTKDASDIKIVDLPVPQAPEGCLLIKVEASPINPSDQMHLLGLYGRPNDMPSLPHHVGGEGAGRVVKLGAGVSEYWLNKKVTFTCDPHNHRKQGTWQQYIIKKARIPHIFVVPESVPFTLAASFWVNPLTALGIWDLAKKTPKNKGIIMNAGASALGKMVLRFCLSRQIPMISIVRREEQVRILKELGAKFIINTADANWKKTLAQMSERLEIKFIADAIGGREAGVTLQQLPRGSVLLNYGALSQKSVSGVAEADLIFFDKQIRGFWLSTWMNDLNPLEIQDYLKTISDDFTKGGKIFGTKSIKEFAMEKWQEAVQYQIANASTGKVYLRPHL